MNSNAKAMVLASFAADSLSLGVHWIYNTNVIDKKWGRVETYIKPERPTYHPTKDLGEFTHYGDQTMLLLESVSAHAGFDLNDFARVVWNVLQGQPPGEGLKTAKDGTFNTEPYSRWIDEGLQSTAGDTRQVIKDFGQMCEVDAAFPGVVHLIAKYENDLYGALVENAMAGGDSAGRGLIVGLVVGAHMGMESIPSPWLTDLKAYDHVMNLMATIDQNQ